MKSNNIESLEELADDIDDNLKGMDVVDIEALIKKLESAKQKKKDDKLKAAWRVFLDEVESQGISISHAVNICKGDIEPVSRVLRIKYRDPKNPNNVWAGRGRTPIWLSNYIEQGRDKADFKV